MLETPKPYKDCSPEERDFIQSVWGDCPIPEDAMIHIDRYNLVIEKLNLDAVAKLSDRMLGFH